MEIRINHLTKRFPGNPKKNIPDTTAVNDLNVVVEDGTLLGLLGPSGCGKSTTLYMIAGLKQPTEGEIWFGDEDVTHLAPEKRGIGLVFQNYALYPHMTVYDNVKFPLTFTITAYLDLADTITPCVSANIRRKSLPSDMMRTYSSSSASNL